LAAVYLREFEKLWGAQPIREDEERSGKIKINDGLEIEARFSPEEGNVILDKLCEVLKGAQSSIYFAQFTITLPEIADILIERANNGIDVRGVMEYDQIGMFSQYQRFESAAMDIEKDKNYCFSFHHKFFIVDGKKVVTGSLNPSRAGLNKNRENILFIESPEVAQEYLNYFKSLN
jgi:phosphatidylserine/phosphatidylglycerophosphate/cardiolipin synthase-like enzyme